MTLVIETFDDTVKAWDALSTGRCDIAIIAQFDGPCILSTPEYSADVRDIFFFESRCRGCFESGRIRCCGKLTIPPNDVITTLKWRLGNICEDSAGS